MIDPKRERINGLPRYGMDVPVRSTVKAEQPFRTKRLWTHSISEVMDFVQVFDGMTVSFHHHLRNGDQVMNLVLSALSKTNVKSLNVAASSVFPGYTVLSDLIRQGRIHDLYANYVNGPVADAIGENGLTGLCFLHTHGGRARAIECGELAIDVAFLAAPSVDKDGNACGTEGKNACGSLGYADSDLRYAKKVVLVTDTLLEDLPRIDLDGRYVDAVLVVDSIGEAEGIVSGTTKITRDPVGLSIAKTTLDVLEACGLIKDRLSMQTGAGGISLAVTEFVKTRMRDLGLVGRFASGGITKSYVDMLEEGLLERLYDVQCFDLDAVQSLRKHPNHHAMTAAQYAGIHHPKPIVDDLDFVILGATEIDLQYNVNVATDSFGKLIGGSGGHADTAAGAAVTIITTQLIKGRLPIVKERVTTVTTPGEHVDILVTERGVAVNPRRTDLIERLRHSQIDVVTIETLLSRAHALTGVPRRIPKQDAVVGAVLYRDGRLIDTIHTPIRL
jgi:citrate lyase subunit alpha/citrate CoA-transferase